MSIIQNKTSPTTMAFLNGLISLLVLFATLLMFSTTLTTKANAQASNRYSSKEVVNAGHKFFGSTSGNIAAAIEKAFSRYGLPNGYILGEEASGAFIGGLTYGEGVLYTKNAGDHKVYYQGPSLGFDAGADGNRTMMLVYNLPAVSEIYKRYWGVSGSAYLIGGVGVTALTRRGVHLIPIKTGVGARLGVNIGYLKLRQSPHINPF